VRPFKKNAVKVDMVSDFSCNERSDEPEPDRVMKNTAKTVQKSE
jgi:hypothetical protein